jgi:hypothetical protein
MQQGKYEAGVARQNAVMERSAAEESIRAGGDERRDFWRKVGQIRGQQTASMAANGIDLGYGTAARIQDDTTLMANEDASNLYRNIEERTKGHIISASNYKMEAKAAKARGTAAFVSSGLQAAGSLLSGVQQSRQMRAKIGTGHG